MPKYCSATERFVYDVLNFANQMNNYKQEYTCFSLDIYDIFQIF